MSLPEKVVNKDIEKYISNDWIPAALLNQSHITVVKGVRGSGKTLWTAICLYLKWKAGYTVFHNGALKFNGKNAAGGICQELDIADMLSYTVDNDLKNCYIMIDEAQVVFDSWSGGATYLKKLIHYITQLRHKNINMYLTTQFVSDISSRVRQQIDYVVSPSSYMRIYTSGAKKGMIKDHRIDSYYTSTENTPFGMQQSMLPRITNCQDFYNIYDTQYMVDHSELEEFTTEKVRENIEAQREYHLQKWFTEKVIPKYANKRVPIVALTNAWNEETGDIIDSKHFTRIIKHFGLAAKRKGRDKSYQLTIPENLNISLDL